MDEKIYTVEQIARLINMHPKTIRRFIRDGRLRAHKVGKEWRVSGHDLSVFVEDGDQSVGATVDAARTDSTGPSETHSLVARRKVMVSAVVDIEIADKEEYVRLSNTLLAVLNTPDPDHGQSTINMRYYEQERRLKVMIWGAPTFVEGMIGSIAVLTDER